MTLGDPDGHDGVGAVLEKTVEYVEDGLAKLVDGAEGALAEAGGGASVAGSSRWGLLAGPAIYIGAMLHPASVGQSDADERAAIQQASQERAAQNGGVDPQAEHTPEPHAASGGAMKGGGRGGKQERLDQLGKDDKVSSADRGWIKQDQNAINNGKRDKIRNPPGQDLAHQRGREAAKGYSYKHSNLQNRKDHQTQHKYDNYGRKNKERPIRYPEKEMPLWRHVPYLQSRSKQFSNYPAPVAMITSSSKLLILNERGDSGMKVGPWEAMTQASRRSSSGQQRNTPPSAELACGLDMSPPRSRWKISLMSFYLS
jgi:hypothetical protein